MYNCVRGEQNSLLILQNWAKLEGYKPEKQILTWLSQQGLGTLEKSR